MSESRHAMDVLKPIEPRALIELIAGHRYSLHDERTLQEAIAIVLSRAGVLHVREASLGEAGVIDFLVEGRIGLELKANGSAASVARQLHRYAAAPQLESIVLVTTRASHRRLPELLLGKPLLVLHLIASSF